MAVPPVLVRYEIQVLTNKSETDAAQVPASATIAFYRQGATTTNSSDILVAYIDPNNPPVPLPAPTSIPVYHIGSVLATDLLEVDIDSSALLTVDSVDTTDPLAPLISVYNFSQPAGVTVRPGDRLLRRTNNLIAYGDPTGRSPIGPAPLSTLSTDPATGRASGYIRAFRFDYKITGSGLAARIVYDAVGSYVMRT